MRASFARTWCSSSWTFSSWPSLAATCHTRVATDSDVPLRLSGASGCEAHVVGREMLQRDKANPGDITEQERRLDRQKHHQGERTSLICVEAAAANARTCK